MRWVSRRSGFSLIEIAVYALILVLSGTLVSNFSGTKASIRQNAVRDDLLAVDQALSTWYMSHSATYPDDLGVLRDLGLLPATIDTANLGYGSRDSGKKYFLRSLDPAEISPRSQEWGYSLPAN